MKNQSLFFLLLLFSFNLSAIEWLYRGDSRPPETIIAAGGMFPLGQLTDYSLYFHSFGGVGYDVYVSTSTSIDVSISFAPAGYVYHIHPAANMYSLVAGLGRYNPFPNQAEYAALGGIPLQQIRGWQSVGNNNELGPLIENPEYQSDIYSSMTVSPDEDAVRLAGFPSGHRAWGLEPWLTHGLPDCGNNKSTRSESCSAASNQFAIDKLAALKKQITNIQPPINQPLKIRISDSRETCVKLSNGLVKTTKCSTAPNVRLTREGLFQFENYTLAELPFCLKPSEKMLRGLVNWDYLKFEFCSTIDFDQKFKLTKKNSYEADIRSTHDFRLSEYKGWLIVSLPGYEGNPITITNGGSSRYFEGTEPLRNITALGMRYQFKNRWWYPSILGSFVGASRNLAYVYYNKDTKKIIDSRGRCINSQSYYETDSANEKIELEASIAGCDINTPSTRWNVVHSSKNGKFVTINSESGRTLMSWHNDIMINPRFISTRMDNWKYGINVFEIFPSAKSNLGIYDDNDVMKIYEDGYKKGKSITLTESVRSLGSFNRKMSSFTVPAGWIVVLYEGENHTGKYYTRSHSIDFDDVINDKIQSIQITNQW